MARDLRMPVGVDIAVDIVDEIDKYVSSHPGVTKRLVFESALRAWLLGESKRVAAQARKA